MNKEIIIINNAVKKFHETTALNNISVSFDAGKIHGIIGRNGSGKTVLFKCICGMMPLTSGEIFVGGKKIGKDLDVPQNTGVIIESPGFLPNYNGYKNLLLLASISKKVRKDEIRKFIEKVGLDPYSKKHVSKYSLGMRQRLGIAQSIMEDPEILVLDEPLNGLDKHGVLEMRELFLELKTQGKTMLLASHNAEDIKILCDTVHEMDNGDMQMIIGR